MSSIKEKISATVDKLTHKSGTNANTGHTGTGTTASDYRDNTTSGVGATDYNKNSGLGTTSGGNTGNLETGGYNTTSGMGNEPGMGATDSAGYTTTNVGGGETRGTTMGTGEVIDSETFTKTEDHQRLVEKKKYELEHHPVEKQYVVETKFVGEANVPGGPTEVVGRDSAVVDERVEQAPAGDRTVVVENVDAPAGQMRGSTGNTTY